MKANIASENTKKKIIESKQKIKNFRFKTNKRVQKIHCQQSRQHKQRQLQLRENLQFLVDQSSDYTKV